MKRRRAGADCSLVIMAVAVWKLQACADSGEIVAWTETRASDMGQ